MDELRLGLQCLPDVAIEGALGDVAINLHDRVRVTLTQDASLALLNVRGPPRPVQMMQGNEPLLHIRPRAHLLSAAEKDPHLARANLLEQGQLLGIALVILDECQFVAGNAARGELGSDVIVNREPTVFGRGEIAEDQLRRTVGRCALPDLVNALHSEIHFAFLVVAGAVVHQPQVEGRLPAL